MMAQLQQPHRPFIIEITPTAWKQISHLPQDTYLVLQERLRTLVELASTGRHPRPAPSHESLVEISSSFVVGDLAAIYEADHQSRAIRLLEVARRLPTTTRPGHEESSGSGSSSG
jgi:hypothetical protein